MRKLMLLAIVSVFCLSLGVAHAGLDYPDPAGGWTYTYTGAAASGGADYTALDGTWSHNNGSDQWDERRQFPAPKTPEDISPAAKELQWAIDVYKMERGLKRISVGELLGVLEELGYHRD